MGCSKATVIKRNAKKGTVTLNYGHKAIRFTGPARGEPAVG
jgi:hypothetical protein